MSKVKWGVLGTAGIARGCTIPGMKLADNCELYAIAGRSKEKADEFKAEFGFEKAYGSYDELLADSEVQVVYIPLPNDIHYEWVMKAINAGKNVLCEKPMAPTAKQAEELFAAAKANNVILMEAFAYLHSPYVSAVKSEIESGVIGKVCYMESAFLTQGYDMSNIRMHKELYGGATYDLGCYSTSMILWMLDKEPSKIQAVSEFTDEKIDIFTTAFLQFDDGTRASINCGMVFDKTHPARMDRLYIHGDKGYIKSYTGFNMDGDLEYTVCVDGVETVKTVNSRQNYCLEIEQMGRCILDGENQHVTPGFSVKNAKVIDGILSSIGY